MAKKTLPGAPTAASLGKTGANAQKGLTGPVEVTATNQLSLMPHTEGSTWTYAIEIEQQRAGTPPTKSVGEISYKIDAAKKRGDETHFLLGIYQDGKKKDEQMWSTGPKGIYQLSIGPQRRTFDPPQPVMIFPIKVGETFKWEGSSRAASGRRVRSKLEGVVVGSQTVDTVMGPADALLIQSQTLFDLTSSTGQKVQGGTVTDSFFRPGVGIVRYRQTTRAASSAIATTLRLKSYKIN